MIVFLPGIYLLLGIPVFFQNISGYFCLATPAGALSGAEGRGGG